MRMSHPCTDYGRHQESCASLSAGRCRLARLGAWRSLVAHQSGGLVVVGSNPAAPTIFPHEIPEPRFRLRTAIHRQPASLTVPYCGGLVGFGGFGVLSAFG